MSGSTFRHTHGTSVEEDAILLEVFNVTSQPFCFALADLTEDFRIDNGCFRE